MIDFDEKRETADREALDEEHGTEAGVGAPARRFGSRMVQRMIQRRAGGARTPSNAQVGSAAQLGTSGASGKLPHFEAVQRSFGRHDLSELKAHTDGTAARGADAMEAEAFTAGDRVAFGAEPSLHTAAHEAAHFVQQRSGATPAGGVGREGDAHEHHADEVADHVVQGRSSEALLDRVGGARAGGSPAATVQRKVKVNNKPVSTASVKVKGKKLTKLQGLCDDKTTIYHFATNEQLLAYLDGDEAAAPTTEAVGEDDEDETAELSPGDEEHEFDNPESDSDGEAKHAGKRKRAAAPKKQAAPKKAAKSAAPKSGGGKKSALAFEEHDDHDEEEEEEEQDGDSDGGERKRAVKVTAAPKAKSRSGKKGKKAPAVETKEEDESPEMDTGADASGAAFGAAPPEGRGGYGMVRRASFGRRDSLGDVHRVAGSDYHDQLRDKNVGDHKKFEKFKSKAAPGKPSKGLSPGFNTVVAGLTVAFRRPDGASGVWHQPVPSIPVASNSGAVQARDGADFDGHLTALFTDHKKEFDEHSGDLNVPKGEGAYAGGGVYHPDAHAHSETAFVADPARDTRMLEALLAFAATLSKPSSDEDGSGGSGDGRDGKEEKTAQTKVVSVVLDADSYPNTVCTNACRPAMQIAQAALDKVVKKLVEAQADLPFTLSAKYATDLRISSFAHFKKPKKMRKKKPGEVVEEKHPLVRFGKDRKAAEPPIFDGGAGASLEIYPDGRRGKGGNKEVEQKPVDQARLERLAAEAERANFWTRVEERLGKRDLSVIDELSRAEAEQLLGSLKDALELVLGYPGMLPEAVLKQAIRYLIAKRRGPDSGHGAKMGSKRWDGEDDDEPGGGGGRGPLGVPVAGGDPIAV